MGTTGASMLLIRPLIRANDNRKHKAHVVVFFIFIVSNAGGSLTPLGDPPLFLGFLKGVDFFWTVEATSSPRRCSWSASCCDLLRLDSWYFRKRRRAAGRPDARHARHRLRRRGNFWLLGGVVGLVLLSGFWKSPSPSTSSAPRSACRGWCAMSAWSR
jgi:Na+/H+ antiporter NhaD/arsenite permease-like protein